MWATQPHRISFFTLRLGVFFIGSINTKNLYTAFYILFVPRDKESYFSAVSKNCWNPCESLVLKRRSKSCSTQNDSPPIWAKILRKYAVTPQIWISPNRDPLFQMFHTVPEKAFASQARFKPNQGCKYPPSEIRVDKNYHSILYLLYSSVP